MLPMISEDLFLNGINFTFNEGHTMTKFRTPFLHVDFQSMSFEVPHLVLLVVGSDEVCEVPRDTVTALADATRTAYIRGRWVFTDSSGQLQHCIVSPSLPDSGDYSAYNVWGEQVTMNS
jgi:hypothetical protein